MIYKIVMLVLDVFAGIFTVLTEDENPVKRCVANVVYVVLKFFVELPSVKSFFNKVSEWLRCKIRRNNSEEDIEE